MKFTLGRLRRIISENLTCLRESSLQAGDLVDVANDFNKYVAVRIEDTLDDVSQHSGLDSGAGFSGTTPNGEEIIFSADQIIPGSYEKYFWADDKNTGMRLNPSYGDLAHTKSGDSYFFSGPGSDRGSFRGQKARWTGSRYEPEGDNVSLARDDVEEWLPKSWVD